METEHKKTIPLGVYDTGKSAIMGIRPRLVTLEKVPALSINDTLILLVALGERVIPKVRESGLTLTEAITRLEITIKEAKK